MTPWPAGVPVLPLATPRDRPVGLLLRHAERPPIPPGDSGHALPLTAEGRRHAKALGAAIAADLRRVHTSPLPRCRETAAAICDGARVTVSPLDDRTLGDPGVFIADGVLAWTNWLDLGHASVMDHLAWSDRILPGMVAPAQAAAGLLDHIVSALADAPGLHLFLTHDAILFPTVARRLPAADSHCWWPEFLEAASVWSDAGRPRLAYRLACTQ